ncbi:hypothetical protein [Mucilaginibacter psychrotolerans]|uniref:Outer membrane protein beta-barrel domain-containing protein n=1 Tax=Mucilaginibacter psychrotolerans TaxID=1524096 RepID=A0A4Y8SFX0_9SPHI|nr:hypothetical protein [Mucilaginibacter psychrotolerans]TFF37782.1 hypothetical protein E2R66_11490 [Mucilaginibacter psychrotolerans]
MKTSLKSSVLFVSLLGLVTAAKAQEEPKSKLKNGIIYSAGVESGLTLGNFNDKYKWNLGGSLQADIPVAANWYITANAGYNNFFGKDNNTDLHLIPVKAGIKYFPVGLFYVQAEGGAAFAVNKSDVEYERTAAFIYSPQAGLKFPLGGSNSFIDAGVRYEASTKFAKSVNSSKVNFLGVRVAYALATK